MKYIMTKRDIELIVGVFKKYNEGGLIPRLDFEEGGLLSHLEGKLR